MVVHIPFIYSYRELRMFNKYRILLLESNKYYYFCISISLNQHHLEFSILAIYTYTQIQPYIHYTIRMQNLRYHYLKLEWSNRFSLQLSLILSLSTHIIIGTAFTYNSFGTYSKLSYYRNIWAEPYNKFSSTEMLYVQQNCLLVQHLLYVKIVPMINNILPNCSRKYMKSSHYAI